MNKKEKMLIIALILTVGANLFTMIAFRKKDSDITKLLNQSILSSRLIVRQNNQMIEELNKRITAYSDTITIIENQKPIIYENYITDFSRITSLDNNGLAVEYRKGIERFDSLYKSGFFTPKTNR